MSNVIFAILFMAIGFLAGVSDALSSCRAHGSYELFGDTLECSVPKEVPSVPASN